MKKRLELIISGKVQGVFFRKFIKEKADLLNLKGFVQNKPNNILKIVAEGEDSELQKLLEQTKIGPRLAKVENIEINWLNSTNEFKQFSIKY